MQAGSWDVKEAYDTHSIGYQIEPESLMISAWASSKTRRSCGTFAQGYPGNAVGSEKMSWKLQEGSVEAVVGPFTAVLTPEKPQLGLGIIRSGKTLGQIFAVGVPEVGADASGYSFTLEEAYQRGEDFIVRFDQSMGDSFAFQLDWRLLPETGACAGVELWLSVQTDDLDSSPVLSIASDIGSDQWSAFSHQDLAADSSSASTAEKNAQTNVAALLCKSSSDSASLLWLVEPTDQRHAVLQGEPTSSARQIRLFDHFMEKGVIRRARMRCHVSDEGFTDEQIRSLYQDLENSPLPLTA